MKLFANVLASWSGFLAPAVGKGFVILALVFGIMWLWRRSTAAGRHLAWTMTFLCLLCLPIFVRCLPTWRTPTWMAPAVLNNGLPDALSFVLQDQSRSESKSPVKISGNVPGAHPLTDISPRPASAKYVVTWRDIAVVIWIAGMVMGLTWFLVVKIRLGRMAGRMQACENRKWLKWIDELRMEYRIRRQIRLLASGTSASLMTWGFWRPIIVLPAESRQWPEERLRVVLRHELAHVKRWDCLTQDIASVVCALYWFNPLTWLAARRMRVEREKACDDFVLNAGARPSEYAGHLVEIAQQFASDNCSGAVAMARPSGLEQRVTAILDGRRNRNRIAKTTALFIVLVVLGFGLLIGGCSNMRSQEKWSLNHSEVAPQLKAFVAEKEAQANAAFKADGKPMPSEFKTFFAAAAKGDWPTMSNDFENFRRHAPQYEHSGKTDLNLRGTAWQAVIETWGTFDNLAVGDEKYSVAYANDIIDSIPPGSIYFGGTDPGRFLITGMEKSQVNADPFFLLTQNALADSTYLDYLHSMYGGKIYIPTTNDLQRCFQDYVVDAQKRMQNHQLKPGENVATDANGHVQISGQVAVMQINGLLTKVIFDENPDHQFYIEQSFPLDWMYPYLEPHGLIFKINRKPLAELPEEIVQQDHNYWARLIQPKIGDWLNDNTSVQEIADFARRVFLQHHFSGFTGDPQFVQNDYSCKMFSKERANIAGLYVWRMKHAKSSAEKESMAHAADFAFRQALALCPYSPEAAKSYEDFLISQNRQADAELVSQLAAQFPSAAKPESRKSFKSAVGASSSPVFEMRLVQDFPSTIAQRMTLVSRDSTTGQAHSERLYVQKPVLLDQTSIQSAKVSHDGLGNPIIDIDFTSSGRKRFARITHQNIGRRLAIIIDGQVCSAPVIQAEISGGVAQITGGFTGREAKALARKINKAVGT